jgi:hypothetical protein
MKSILKYLLVQHVVPLTLCSSAALYAVSRDLSGSYSELLSGLYFLLYLKTFGWVFFIGALVLGMGEALRPGLAICKHLVQGNDLNDSQFRVQLQKFIVFVVEIYVAILGLFLTRL